EHLALASRPERRALEVAAPLDDAQPGVRDERLELGGKVLPLAEQDDALRPAVLGLVVEADDGDLADRIVVVARRVPDALARRRMGEARARPAPVGIARQPPRI